MEKLTNAENEFFISNQVKNGVKVKQLAKQPPTLKTLMQKILVRLGVKKFTFSILSSLKLNFFQPFLARDNLIVCKKLQFYSKCPKYFAKYGSLMMGTFELTNCFYFVTVISTFDTAYLCFFCDEFISSSFFVLDKSF